MPDVWSPRYTITPEVLNALMEIAAARADVEGHVWSPVVEEAIRHRARLRSTHFSTRIEGNRLTLAETEAVIEGRQVVFGGRERDVREVAHYWQAMLQVEDWARQGVAVTEEALRRLHAIVEHGLRRRPTPYRDQQNVIREASSRSIVYMPPEWSDVPPFMAALVAWIAEAERQRIPAPVIAGLTHYQVVTIHPFMDGNGRTARLLATWLLHRGGYGLHGFYSLEEYHARDLDAYYRELATHAHHNYYMGRAEVDLTLWLTYFVAGVAHVFRVARDEALRQAERGIPPEPEEVRRLDARARRVLALFAKQDTVTAVDVGALLPVGDRMVRQLLAAWVDAGFLVVHNPSNRARSYALSAIYRRYMRRLSESTVRQPPSDASGPHPPSPDGPPRPSGTAGRGERKRRPRRPR